MPETQGGASQDAQPNDLSGFMQQQPYQFDPGTGEVIAQPEEAGGQSTQTQGAGVANAEGASPAAGNIGQAAQSDQAQQGVTSPANSEAEQRAAFFQAQAEMLNQRLEQASQIMRAAAQDAERQETVRFEESIKDLEPAEQQAKRLERQLSVVQMQNNHLRQQQQTIEQQNEVTRQQTAKAKVAMDVAAQYGIPADKAHMLMGAVNYQHMHAIAQDVATMVPSQQQAQQPVQQRPVQNQVADLASGADNTASALTSPAPEMGSGDIYGFLKSRQYQWVPVRED